MTDDLSAMERELHELREQRAAHSAEIATLYFRLGQATGAFMEAREALKKLAKAVETCGVRGIPMHATHPALADATSTLGRLDQPYWLPALEKADG